MPSEGFTMRPTAPRPPAPPPMKPIEEIDLRQQAIKILHGIASNSGNTTIDRIYACDVILREVEKI